MKTLIHNLSKNEFFKIENSIKSQITKKEYDIIFKSGSRGSNTDGINIYSYI